ncbi:MAG: hypothetical protein NTV88_01605 [Candidatus Micrarchaeota archaeon]|nr:hypothetical protein [Candidatus Micrarchaeota archaeon]
MGLDLKGLKNSLEAKVKWHIGEFLLPKEQRILLKNLFSSSEKEQLEAATALGKIPDLQLLCLLQFYMQDNFLNELLGSLPGDEFQREVAGKKAIKFYSLLAASSMLSERSFFDYVVQMMGSGAVPTEQRCDLICIMGSVFEAFGANSGSKEAVEISEQCGEEFVKMLLDMVGIADEKPEVKSACFVGLKKVLSNPNVSLLLDPEISKAAFWQVASNASDLKSSF